MFYAIYRKKTDKKYSIIDRISIKKKVMKIGPYFQNLEYVEI